MSVRALSGAWDSSGASGGTLLVLLAIADQANVDGVAWPLQESLAAKSRQHERNVERCVNWLQDNGELDVWKFQPRQGGPERLGYRILLGDLAAQAGVVPEELTERARGGIVKARLSPVQRRAVLERDGYRCVRCESTDKGLRVIQATAVEAPGFVTLCAACARLVPDKLSGDLPDNLSGTYPTIHPSRPDNVPGARVGVTSGFFFEPSGTVNIADTENGVGEKALDHVWEAMAVTFGQPTNRNEQKRRGAACKLIRESLVATAAEHGLADHAILTDRAAIDTAIRRRAARWSQIYAGANLTDTALANHWAELRPPRPTVPSPSQRADAEPDVTAEARQQSAGHARAALEQLRRGTAA